MKKSLKLIKVWSAAILISLALFILDKQWNLTSYHYQLSLLFKPPPPQSQSQSHTTLIVSFPPSPSPQQQPQPQLQSSSPQPLITRFGILDDNGTMADEFEVGEFDPDLVEDWEKNEHSTATPTFRVTIKKLGFCPISMAHYLPCFHTNLNSTHRHCPTEADRWNCLVPPPNGYKPPLPWPKSRGEVWFANLLPPKPSLHRKTRPNSMFKDKDKLAQSYLNQISKMVSDIKFGVHTRVVLDIGCGVPSFGAVLFSHNAISLSIAPHDTQDNQIQVSLERGLPAMVATIATHRLHYPSQAFDLIHCSGCRVNWMHDDGILLLEVNRMLRAGGYFVWATQQMDKHEEASQERWKEMEDLSSRLCWELVNREGYIAVWRKPLNNICYTSRPAGSQPPLCDLDDDPDNVWSVDLKSCISWLPENGYGANIMTWPSRLQSPPDRLQSIQMDAYMARKELFKADSKYWNETIARYIRIYRWKKFKLRNVMDMKAGFGGFGAALVNNQIDCWVMNVIPITAPNTLPVIFDRGFIGVMHDWCEPFDTYPRTYDLVHAAGLLSTEHQRCNISMIMLEIDRILRPGGRAYIRDSINLMDEIQENAKAMGWNTKLHDTAEGPHASWRVFMGEKRRA